MEQTKTAPQVLLEHIRQDEERQRKEGVQITTVSDDEILNNDFFKLHVRAMEAYATQYRTPTVAAATVATVAEGEGFDYPAAARAIALWLKEYCNEELPYPEMIADAARKVKQDRDNWVEMWRTSCDEIKFYKRFVEKERKVTKESLQLRQQLASLQAENAELRKKNDWLLNRR